MKHRLLIKYPDYSWTTYSARSIIFIYQEKDRSAMSYSIIGILASLILIITNRDILWYEKELDQVRKNYRRFLMGVMVYYTTDLLWGILYDAGLTTILYADTEVHFTAMAAAVMFWTQYVISYLGSGNTFEKILDHPGRIFLHLYILCASATGRKAP